jgi:hypothetical protein
VIKKLIDLVSGGLTSGPVIWLIAGAVGLFSYTAWIENRGYKRCKGEVATAVVKEQKRQQNVISSALENASKQAQVGQAREAELESKVRELVETAKKPAPVGVCVTGDDARRLRDLQRR